MIQKGYRTLVLWIAWAAAALVIYLGLYQDTDVWTFVQNDPSRITWSIILLFAMGVVASFALTLVLTFESVQTDRMERIARQQGWKGVQSQNKRLILRHFFHHLGIVLDNNGELNIEALVDVEFAIYQRIAHGLEIVGNLLITLGLIGTVVGLTLTLIGLTGSLEALGEDQEQLLAGLRGAMSGMGTAFYTTLLGSVLGGVLLRIFAHIDQNGVELLEETLVRVCLVHCSADFRPSLERDIRIINSEIERLNRSVAELRQLLEESRGTIGAFSRELKQLQETEADETSVRKALQLRKEYQQSLEQEFHLRQAMRGRWWHALINSLRSR